MKRILLTEGFTRTYFSKCKTCLCFPFIVYLPCSLIIANVFTQVDIVVTDRTGRVSRTQTLVADNKSVRKRHTQQYDLVLPHAEHIRSFTLRRTETIKYQDW